MTAAMMPVQQGYWSLKRRNQFSSTSAFVLLQLRDLLRCAEDSVVQLNWELLLLPLYTVHTNVVFNAASCPSLDSAEF